MKFNFDEGSFSAGFDNDLFLFVAIGHLKKFKLFVQSIAAISPTSTDVERSFSLSGYIMQPRRQRMNEDLLNAIVIISKFYKLFK